MDRKIYEIVEMPNGLKMMAVLPIIETGVAEAYATVRDNPLLGVSKGDSGPFSANLYKLLGQKEGCVDFQTACKALGISDRTVITNRLTAITDIVRVVDASDLEGYDIYDEPAAPRADGLVTTDHRITLFNYAADCAITFMVDPVRRIIGSHHASWRGSLKGIFESEVHTFVEQGSDPKDIIAVIMPSISKENFEIGSDAAEMFEEAGYGKFVDYTSYKKPHADLPAMNRHILLSTGLREENVYVIDDQDTFVDQTLWHSFRRGPIDSNGIHLNGQNGYFIRLKCAQNPINI